MTRSTRPRTGARREPSGTAAGKGGGDALRDRGAPPVGGDRHGDDPLREQLLTAASRVFAREGYDGTKILDIVREAGLSTGAVYSRFRSKNELLRAAVIRSTAQLRVVGNEHALHLLDLLRGPSALRHRTLSDSEAVRLEAYVTARREPEVAAALADAHERWRESVLPLIEAARADGTLRPDVDTEALVFLFRTLYLGTILHRGSGLPGPDPAAWESLLGQIADALGPGSPA